jgi:hypothetical protein
MATPNPNFDSNQNGDEEEQINHDEEFADGTTTIVSSLSSTTTSSWVPPPPALLRQQQQQQGSVQSSPPPPSPGMTSATTPAFGMKAVYSRNEAAAEAGAVAAARQEEGLSITSNKMSPPLVPLARNPSVGGSAAPGARRNSHDDQPTSPPPLTRTSTPGAISVPGVGGSLDDDQHDNLLDHHGDHVVVAPQAYNSISSVAPSTPPPEHRPELSSPSSLAALTCDSSPIIAELASSAFSYDTQDVEDRLAERLEAQMNERLREEVDRRLSQERRQHAIAEVVQKDGGKNNSMEQHPATASTGLSATTASIQQEENFKICGIRRTCWGMILCTILLLIIGGVVGIILWFARDNEKDNAQPTTAAPVQPPASSFVPTATTFPSSTPTVPLTDQRWDYLIAELGPVVVPSDTDPKEYFADESTPQYAALEWMATTDLATEVLETPVIVLMERYALAHLYFATDGPASWTDSLDFLSSGNVCDWNDGDKGVFCIGGPLVTNIILPSNGLQATIPWELSRLEYLLEIQFDSNSLTGTIPAELGRLANLQSLWIRSNSLSGALPAELASATKLESIDLGNNTISSSLPMEWGSSLSDLFFLGLGNNDITSTLPVDWSRLSNLRVLDLEDNRLDGNLPTEYGLLTQLSSLYLELNDFAGPLPSEYGDLMALRNFFVYGNRLSSTVPAEFAELSSLKVFWFYDNDLTGDVNDIFCVDDAVENIRADCSSDGDGLPPQINCTCCRCV